MQLKKTCHWIMSCLMLAMAVTVTSCRTDTETLKEEVRKMMIENTTAEGHSLIISDFNLIHAGGNYYPGIANCTFDGEKIDIDVNVVCDDSTFQA